MTGTEQLREFAASQHCAFKEGEPLCAYTTFHIGGPAALMLFPSDGEMFRSLIAFCAKQNIHFFVLGKGSNLLISDDGLPYPVICTDRMQQCLRVSDTQIRCDAGVPLVKLCRTACVDGLSGLEFAYGIPGSVGGAVYMNAGAYGGEMRDVLSSVTTVNMQGEIEEMPVETLSLGYRNSIFQAELLFVLSATVRLTPDATDAVRARMEDFMARRKEKQPLNFPSAGSAFKRPEGHFAGALIEQCGLKGYSVGGAQVSEKHAGFIVNRGGASAQDVLQLVDHIRSTVLRETGVLLEPEVKWIG